MRVGGAAGPGGALRTRVPCRPFFRGESVNRSVGGGPWWWRKPFGWARECRPTSWSPCFVWMTFDVGGLGAKGSLGGCVGCLHVLCLGCLRPAGGGTAVFGAVAKCVGPFRFTGLAQLGLGVRQWGFPQKRRALLARCGSEAVVGPRCRGVVLVLCGLSHLEAVSVVDHLPTSVLILWAVCLTVAGNTQGSRRGPWQ